MDNLAVDWLLVLECTQLVSQDAAQTDRQPKSNAYSRVAQVGLKNQEVWLWSVRVPSGFPE